MARNMAWTRYSSLIFGKPCVSQYFWSAQSTCICASASSSTRDWRAVPYLSGSAQPQAGSGFLSSFSERRWKMSFSTVGRKDPCSVHHACNSSPSLDPEMKSSSSLDSNAAALATRSDASFAAAALAAAASSAAFAFAHAFSSSSRLFLSCRALAASSSSPGKVSGASTGASTTSSRFLGASMLDNLLLLIGGYESPAGASSWYREGPVGISIESPPRPPRSSPYLPPPPPRSLKPPPPPPPNPPRSSPPS
mmetsp:Transcript_23127/g.37704  ORF Transcript_23127/g.37704 Transcript_23127/m.37704 type:complete len:251 (+) Transcript_23127:243-995(+)